MESECTFSEQQGFPVEPQGWSRNACLASKRPIPDGPTPVFMAWVVLPHKVTVLTLKIVQVGGYGET